MSVEIKRNHFEYIQAISPNHTGVMVVLNPFVNGQLALLGAEHVGTSILVEDIKVSSAFLKVEDIPEFCEALLEWYKELVG